MDMVFILGQMVENMKVILFIYIGEFIMDKKNGRGIYHWSDGRVFNGIWKEGLQDGKGTYYDANGNPRRGIWNNGKRIKWLDEENQAV